MIRTMIWANNEKGKRIRAFRGEKAFCPNCGNKVLGKAGKIIETPYWSHKKDECDSWARQDPETPWHRNWKNLFPVDQQEISLGEHRADVKTERLVIEFQNSSIGVEDIWAREQFYEDMVWVFNCQEAHRKGRICITTLSEYGHRGIPWSPKGILPYSRSVKFYDPLDRLQVIHWSHRKKSILRCRKPVLLHLGRGLLFNTYYWGHPNLIACNCGLGHFVSKNEFFEAVAGKNDSDQTTLFPLAYTPETSDKAYKRLQKEEAEKKEFLLDPNNITIPKKGDPF